MEFNENAYKKYLKLNKENNNYMLNTLKKYLTYYTDCSYEMTDEELDYAKYLYKLCLMDSSEPIINEDTFYIKYFDSDHFKNKVEEILFYAMLHNGMLNN